MIRRVLICLVALTGFLCSPVAVGARSVWLFESGALTRMDLDAGSVRSMTFVQRPRAIAPTDANGAWVLTEEALVLIDEHLTERLRVTLDFSPVAGGSKLAADSSSGAVWLAQDARIMNFDARGALLGEWSAAAPVRAMTVAGPGEIFIATDFSLTRYDAWGTSLARVDLTQVTGSGVGSLLFDTSGAYLWLARTGALVQFDVLAGIVPHIEIATDNPVALSLNQQTGELTVFAGQRIARYDRDGLSLASAPFADKPLVDVAGVAAFTGMPYVWFGDRGGVGTIEFANGMVRRMPRTGAVSYFISASINSDDYAVEVITGEPPIVTITAPTNGASFVAPASVTLTATATASVSDSTISSVNFMANGGLIGSATAAPYAVVWNVAASGLFTLTAWATDSKGTRGISPAIDVQVSEHGTPTVALTAPTNDARFTLPASITLTATASDSRISAVFFFVDGGFVGVATTEPYTTVWNVARPGTFALTAEVVDNEGMRGVSSPVNVHVNANAGPTVSLSEPAHNATFVAPTDITLAAAANDSDGTIASVQFFVNDSYIGSDDAPPYTFNWNVAGTGMYTLTARATDNIGNWTASAPVSVTVTTLKPTVAITSPNHDSSFVAPATIAISADAAESGGAITHVDFYRDSDYLGTSTAPPYSVTWRDIGVGIYSLTARAFGRLGQWATSLPIPVNVSLLPGTQPTWVEMTSPPANSLFVVPLTTAIELEAHAGHPTGAAVTQVTFYYAPSRGSPRSIAAVTAPPYRLMWTPPPELSLDYPYIAWAEATDVSGTVTPSPGVPFSLVAGHAPSISKLAPHAGTGPVVLTAPATIVFVGEAFAHAGAGGAVTLDRVDLVEGDRVVATLNTGNGGDGEYVFTLRDLPVGTRSYTLKAVDTLGMSATSLVTNVQVVAPNSPPTSALSAPTSGQAYMAPATVALAASVADLDGTISKVEYLNGANVVATSTASPFSAIWANAPAGNYALTARVTDDRGASTVSAAAHVTVQGASSAPLIALTAPAICGSVSSATPITVAAEAISPSSSITRVEFFAGTNLIGTRTADPFAVTWTNPVAGNTILTAKVYDALGQVTTSAPFPISVIGSNTPPTISFTTPTDGQAFLVGHAINVAATAADADGTVKAVEFFAGVTSIGRVSAAPHSVVWSDAAPGVHALTARVTDNTGATSTTPALTVTVAAANLNKAPDIALSAPANGQSFPVGQTITLTAHAADADGLVTTVEFFNGASLLGTVTTPPYAWQWAGVPLGSYTLTAKVTDDRGAAATSANVSIQVVAGGESALAVTSPAPNAVISADFVFVRGTYQAQANSGVTINGTVAQNDGHGQFFVNNLPLVDGVNSITVTLTTAVGQTQIQTLTVTRNGVAPFQIVAEPDTDFGPLTATLRIQSRTANPITEFSIANVGDGQLDITSAGQESLGTITYGTPGVYQPTVTLVDSTGNAYTQTLALLVRDRVANEQKLTKVWNEFANTLAAGDKDAVLAYLSDGAKARYGSAFDVLLPHLPEIVAGWSAPQTSKLAATFAEFAINRNINGMLRLFLVYLLQGHDGVWRIDSM